MERESFDTVIIGAGLAGLCCAGELVLHGRRPLLISETKEVGAIFKVKKLGRNGSAFIQHITWQHGWGGGWWYALARKLNVPLKMYPGAEFDIRLHKSDKTIATPVCVSASALTDVIAGAFSLPESTKQNLDRVLYAALAIPYQELLEMHDVPLGEWLQQHGAEETVANIILALGGQMNDLTVDLARKHQSVLGGIGIFRILLCGEGSLPILYPSIREGLCIPMAHAIEERGGTVWRGCKVDRILVQDGEATGVLMKDGREARAPIVAIAVGNPRIPAFLNPLPPEIETPLRHAADIDMRDFNLFYLLNKTIVQSPRDRMATGIFDPDTFSIIQIQCILSGVAPWTAEPGKQVVVAHTAMPPEEVAKRGGEEAVYKRMEELSEEQYPGLKDAIEDSVRYGNRYHWFTPVCTGPKLPRTIPSIRGLWFVGDGSRPCAGVWTEAAASCGILGARAMVSTDRL